VWFAFDPARLADVAAAMREDYQRARPFPHVVIDDLLPEAVLDAVVDEFPEPNGQWRQFDDPRQKFGGAVDRRVNVLLYLNRDWQPEWGGQLELWNASRSRADQRIEPIFNRMAIFTITDSAFHGHPDPLDCPAGRARRSLAFYYYSNGRPDAEQSEPHRTLFQRRPEEEAVAPSPAATS
jgi:hypothetical protein